jgi:hypothetical protein
MTAQSALADGTEAVKGRGESRSCRKWHQMCIRSASIEMDPYLGQGMAAGRMAPRSCMMRRLQSGVEQTSFGGQLRFKIQVFAEAQSHASKNQLELEVTWPSWRDTSKERKTPSQAASRPLGGALAAMTAQTDAKDPPQLAASS